MVLVPFMLLFMFQVDLPVFSAWNTFNNKYGMVLALIIFSVASITDYYDGKIARSQNIVTDLGKLLDPIADKLLVLSAYIAFASLGRVTLWTPCILLFRELSVTGIRSVAAGKGEIIAADFFGKFKAVCQIISIILLMCEHILSVYISNKVFIMAFIVINNILLVAVIVLTLSSGINYFVKYRHLLTE